MTPLLPWRRKLVALRDLAVLCDIHADRLVDAVGRFVAVLFGIFAGDFLDRDDGTGLAVRHAQRGVAHFAALLAEDGAQQTLLRGQLGFALRGDLADEDIAGFDFGADADDAALVEVRDRVLADVRQIAGDFPAPSLVSRASIVFLMWIGQGVVAQTLQR